MNYVQDRRGLNERRVGLSFVAVGRSIMYAGKRAANTGNTMRGTD